MIFEIKNKKNNFLEKAYEKSMKELNNFFKLNWKYNPPRILIFNKRKDLDNFLGRKTKKWEIAISNKIHIYLLSINSIKKEKGNDYCKTKYSSLLKHELSHCFFYIITKSENKINWLDEGLAIYLSGQVGDNSKIKNFSNFLKYYNIFDYKIYDESGFAVKLLIEKYGKQKFLKLLKSIRGISNKQEFKTHFKRIYNYDLNYSFFNKSLK